MNDAEQLRQLLGQHFIARNPRDPDEAERLQRLNAARQKLTPPRGRHALPRIAQGVLAFRVQGRATPYPYLKYACYGLARPTDWDNRLIIDDTPLFDALSSAVAGLKETQPGAYAACCRALQASWQTDLAENTQHLTPSGRQNSQKLAAFLAQNTPPGTAVNATVHRPKTAKTIRTKADCRPT